MFETVVISLHDTIHEAKSKESKLQLQLNVHLNPLYINQAIKGEFFYHNQKHSEQTKRKISKANRGRKHSVEFNQRRSERMQGSGNHMSGKKHSAKSLEQMSAVKKGVSRNPFTEQHKQRISEALKGRVTSRETKEKLSLCNKEYIKGSFWWNNGTQQQRSKTQPEGWVKGRLRITY